MIFTYLKKIFKIIAKIPINSIEIHLQEIQQLLLDFPQILTNFDQHI